VELDTLRAPLRVAKRAALGERVKKKKKQGGGCDGFVQVIGKRGKGRVPVWGANGSSWGAESKNRKGEDP